MSRSFGESFEKLLHTLSITQISKDDYTLESTENSPSFCETPERISRITRRWLSCHQAQSLLSVQIDLLPDEIHEDLVVRRIHE